ncbi:MAG: restriction endonuclease subunit S [Pyrinomonadaceae bacterium]|nr:restriction endonuclease subunit S [Pyrinomonadaceae bacterium]
MSNAPTSWPDVSLGEICEFKYGKSLPEEKRAGGEIAVYGSNGIVGRHNEPITEGPAIIVGRKGSFGEVHLSSEPCWPIDTTYFIDSSATKTDLRWLAYRLKGLGLTRLNKAAAVPGLNREDAYRQKLKLPPLAEQRRIAEVLDRAEALRAKRRATLAQLDSLAQSLFLNLFGYPGTNPKGWAKGTLGEVATFVGGGTPSRARPEFYSGSICWATSKDMKCEVLDDTQEHITEEAIEQSATNLVSAGTVLIVVKSKILAHSLPVAIARVPTCFGQDLKGIKVSDRCDVVFAATSLRLGKRWLLQRARGINTEGLTLDHLRAFPLLLPPMKLQREFARRVGEVDKLKTAQRASLAEMDALFATLQHRAFRGELWPRSDR